MVSLSDSFTDMWRSLSKTVTCIMRDKFTTRMQVSVVIDDKGGWGRLKKAQNFHKHPEEPQDFQKKRRKRFAWDTVINCSTFSMITIFRDNNNVYRKRSFQYYLYYLTVINFLQRAIHLSAVSPIWEFVTSHNTHWVATNRNKHTIQRSAKAKGEAQIISGNTTEIWACLGNRDA